MMGDIPNYKSYWSWKSHNNKAQFFIHLKEMCHKFTDPCKLWAFVNIIYFVQFIKIKKK